MIANAVSDEAFQNEKRFVFSESYFLFSRFLDTIVTGNRYFSVIFCLIFGTTKIPSHTLARVRGDPFSSECGLFFSPELSVQPSFVQRLACAIAKCPHCPIIHA
jgi:hypothetical protein